MAGCGRSTAHLGGYDAVHKEDPEEGSDDAREDGGEDGKGSRALSKDGAICDELEGEREQIEDNQGSQFDTTCDTGSVWFVG
jgi:hypothetical protein